MLEQLSGQPERRARYHPIRSVRKWRGPKVAVNDSDLLAEPGSFQSVAKLASPDLVGLDCDDQATPTSHGNGEGASSWSELDDELTGLHLGGVDQSGYLTTIDQEVLTEGASSRIAGGPSSLAGHGPSHSQPCGQRSSGLGSMRGNYWRVATVFVDRPGLRSFDHSQLLGALQPATEMAGSDDALHMTLILSTDRGNVRVP